MSFHWGEVVSDFEVRSCAFGYYGCFCSSEVGLCCLMLEECSWISF